MARALGPEREGLGSSLAMNKNLHSKICSESETPGSQALQSQRHTRISVPSFFIFHFSLLFLQVDLLTCILYK